MKRETVLVVAEQSPDFYEQSFGILSVSEIDPLAFYTDVASVGLDLYSWVMKNIAHEGKYRQFIRKEMDYQKMTFSMKDSTAILDEYNSYRLSKFGNETYRKDYKEAKGYEQMDSYDYYLKG